ncbi:hypothetical protein F0P96_03330 [Hymenobacter busanensis]|uniref:Uncharacterized protein n=1 Tax=Hymenobacter busanensis TaxID=2607656 RepID=A0A7L4ZUU9_9BACT|nr:hypothetical protein [Hymenobacter busanensis]KAA9339659.1 hypothetical protein F0P96_03330 [Hymenobacter busanensis]QHJ06586.1 hypothetical protein GUY19_04420 [Hymenobacter busanensis]
MKLLLIFAGNGLVLLGLWRWLRAQRQLPSLGHFVVPALGLRLLSGSISAAVPSADAVFFQLWARRFTQQLWAEPRAWLRMLTQDEFHYAGQSLVYHGHSNTLFLIKLLSALNVVTGGSLWLNALYFSVASFIGCWYLVRVLSRLFPGTRGAAIVGLLLWPSALYWTTGITKESLLLASGAGLLAVALRLLYGGASRRAGLLVMGGLLLAVLQFKMRFFFGGVLLAGLAGLVAVRVLELLGLMRRRWQQTLVFAAVIGSGLWLASEVSPVFRFNKFASQLTRTYAGLREKSYGRPYIDLPHLAPTAESMAGYVPKAVASALFRPFIWEGDSLFYGISAFENLLLLIIMGVALLDVMRRRQGPLPFALLLMLLTYCLALAALLGLSTPNLGTLSRYRASWLPLLVYVLLSQPTVSDWLRRLRLFGIR